jgi:hypothetical protein
MAAKSVYRVSAPPPICDAAGPYWEDFDSITLTPLGSRPLPQKPSAEVILLAALEVVRSHYPSKS